MSTVNFSIPEDIKLSMSYHATWQRGTGRGGVRDAVMQFLNALLNQYNVPNCDQIGIE